MSSSVDLLVTLRPSVRRFKWRGCKIEVTHINIAHTKRVNSSLEVTKSHNNIVDHNSTQHMIKMVAYILQAA